MMVVQVYFIGEFGRSMAEQLSKNWCVTAVAIHSYHQDFHISNDTQLCILISEHPCTVVAKRLEDLCYHANARFLPMIVDHPHLLVGPLSNIPTSACYQCCVDRMMQHNPIAHITKALDAHYAEHIADGPKGFLPSDPHFWSLWLRAQFHESSNTLAGKILRFHLVTREAQVSDVVSVHGCPRCGLGIEEATRSYRFLDELCMG